MTNDCGFIDPDETRFTSTLRREAAFRSSSRPDIGRTIAPAVIVVKQNAGEFEGLSCVPPMWSR